MNTLIQHVDLWTPQEIKIDVDILVSDHRIQKIGKNLECEDVDNKIDGKRMLAMPGLINSHTHVAMTLFRSYADDVALMDWLENHIWPAEAKLNDEVVYWGSQLAFAEMIRGGTTAFCDMYMHMPQVAKAAVDVGMRGNIARGLAGTSPNGEEALQENVALFHEWNQAENGLIRVMLGPHAPYTCPAEYLEKVIDAASKDNIEIHIHLSETQGEVETCREKHGLSPIAYMEQLGLFTQPTLAAHCVRVDADDIAIIAEHNVRVAHNPRSNLKLASGVAPVPQMLAANITVGLATDGASSNNKLDMWEEMQTAALIHKGVSYDPTAIPAQAAVELATSGGAHALGYSDLGELKEGHLADIILIDRSGFHWQPQYNVTSLLAYAAQSSDVDTVMINGKLVMQHRQLLTIDEERLRSEITKAQEYFSNLS